jgi:hypothetical protein
VEFLDQGPRACVGVGVELLVWMATSREEPGQPQHVGMPRAPDEHRSADAGLSARIALAELSLRHQDFVQPARRDDERIDRPRRVRVGQRGVPGELGELAHERARAVRDDRLVAPEHAVLADEDLAAHQDEHAGAHGTARDQHSPAAKVRLSPKRASRSISAASSLGNIWS